MHDYFATVKAAIDLTVLENEETGKAYLDPIYRELLRSSEEIDMQCFENPEELYEILKLEVKKRNAINDRTGFVVSKLFDILEQDIDPALEEENNELLQNMIAYMKENDKLKDKERELNEREQGIEQKKDIAEKLGNAMNIMDFSKKKM